MSEIQKILTERGSRYGDFSLHADATNRLLEVMESSPAWAKMNPTQKQATRVILDKFGRMAFGDPNYDDSWRDIAGYATLVLDRLDPQKDPSLAAKMGVALAQKPPMPISNKTQVDAGGPG